MPRKRHPVNAEMRLDAGNIARRGITATARSRIGIGFAMLFDAGKRRLGRGNLWHDGANRQRRRRRADRRRVLAIEATFSARLAPFASLARVCAVDCRSVPHSCLGCGGRHEVN